MPSGCGHLVAEGGGVAKWDLGKQGGAEARRGYSRIFVVDVIVIGAGASGLAAADELACAGKKTLVLEARSRLGGRILTLRDAGVPLELGAEFVHGSREMLHELVPGLTLETEVVEERHHYREAGQLHARDDLGDVLGAFIQRARALELGELSVAEALARSGTPPEHARLIASFVSGLHAAHPERYATSQLFELEPSRQGPSGTELHRVTGGYDAVIAALAKALERRAVRVITGAVVRRVNYGSGKVEVFTEDGARFEAAQAVVTLPLGVLASGSVSFEPSIDAIAEAASELGVGSVVRAVMLFERAPWAGDGFIHDPGLAFPTFWPSGRGERALTGWASAEAADALEGASEAELKSAALGSLAELLDTSAAELERGLTAFVVKDWQADPFSRGAYSHGLAGHRNPWRRLAQPIDDRLFFAGEATDTEGRDATVAGALASGRRAARQIVKKARA